ncbi:hypothetical protein [Jiangella alba]|uniref:Uncharacterized protein n=1 Tax=Jiangella alba TaxID=561176 RepID=A0A1H5J506_9ACTN|nr:hypothetical protein [Jiangella alba]SEE47510.1 hypothetical protein SAMN04488561_1442 [Jiangella alba]
MENINDHRQLHSRVERLLTRFVKARTQHGGPTFPVDLVHNADVEVAHIRG